MNRFSVPAVLTDGNCKTIIKNQTAQGVKIENDIFEDGNIKNILSRMEPSDVFNVLVEDEDRAYNATVICGDQCRIALLNPVSGKVYINLSGYDVSLESMDIAGKNLFENKLFHIASQRMECLKNPRLASFFRGGKALKDIIFLLETEFGERFRNISCEISSSVKSVFGDEADFVLVSVLALSFCNRYGVGNILSNISFEKGEINLSIKTEIGQKAKCDAIGKNEEGWLYFINLLSEGNLWKFDWGIDGNMLEFRLNMFEYDETAGFILRDSKARKEYISALVHAVAVGFDKAEQ